MIRRLLPALLLISTALLGTGSLDALHNAHHAHEDAAAAAARRDAGLPPQDPPHHHDGNCQLHALLHAPFVAEGPAPLLLSPVPAFADLTIPGRPLASQRVPERCDCRGPPAC